jgi:hypothetical protein
MSNVRRLVNVPVELVAQYSEALSAAQQLAPVSEQSLYALHKKELERLNAFVSSGASAQVIAAHIARERRTFGWSFLSGTHGARVEHAFHDLASALERQCT